MKQARRLGWPNVHNVVVSGKGTEADVGRPEAAATDDWEQGQPHGLGLSVKKTKKKKNEQPQVKLARREETAVRFRCRYGEELAWR